MFAIPYHDAPVIHRMMEVGCPVEAVRPKTGDTLWTWRSGQLIFDCRNGYLRNRVYEANGCCWQWDCELHLYRPVMVGPTTGVP